MILSLALPIALASLPALAPQRLRFQRAGTYPGGCGGGGSSPPNVPEPGTTSPPGSPGSGGPGDGVPGSSSPGNGAPPSPGPGGTTANPRPSPGPAPGAPRSPGAPTLAPLSPLALAAESDWRRWWQYNRESFLIAGTFVTLPESGDGARRSDGRPSAGEIHERIVPALRAALSADTDPNVQGAVLLALGRIGPASATDESAAALCESFLADAHQGLAETACISLGILGRDAALPTLTAVLQDEQPGRALVERSSVPDRMRAFAAYALGLSAHRSTNPDARRYVTATLLRVLEGGERDRGVRIACAVGLGLSSPEGHGRADVPATPSASASNSELTKRLLALFERGERDDLVRAHLPTAVGRLAPLASEGVRRAAVKVLLDALSERSRERNEVRQSCALALGELGDADAERLDREIRDGLTRATKDSDLGTRHFALLSLARVAARPGEGDDPLHASSEARAVLFGRLASAPSATRAWAALALGVAGFDLRRSAELQRSELVALRTALEKNRSPERRAALALAAGLSGDDEAAELMLDSLDGREGDTGFARHLTLALGLSGARSALEPLRALLRGAGHQPELLEDAALALRLLGDRELVDELEAVRGECDCALSQSACATALGRTRDARAVAPLLSILEDTSGPSSQRTWAALALGELADTRPLPWTTEIGAGLNYDSAEPTLTDPLGGGILDYR